MTRSALFTVASAAVALHVADDSFLQPEPATSATDHLAGGLIPLLALALAVVAFPRLRAGAQATLALVTGFFGLVASSEALYYTTNAGPTGDDFTGLLCIPAGLALAGLGAAILWRSRRRTDTRRARYTRRLIKSAAAAGIALLVLFPLGYSYVATHAARGYVPAAKLGADYERVSFTTSDGLELKGWYVPSRNGAAVIAFPGRRGPQTPARLLARRGYGVLLFDRRGEGESDGDPNSFGWGGDKDIIAAAAYLRSRPDVSSGRIGGLGLSVGGELMLQVAAEGGALDAVVSEGAGTRTFSEDVDVFDGAERLLALPFLGTKTAAVAVFSSSSPPPKLLDLMPRIKRPVLIIHNGGPGERISHDYYRAIKAPSAEWVIPESAHTGGATARPHEYEQRVAGFFDEALLSNPEGKAHP
jgi:MYXO-CTERM domain-containing protein